MKKLAVLGPKGTFSDNAAQEYRAAAVQELECIYYPTIDETFHAIGASCDFGIIPIENTLDGYVQRTLDLLLETDTTIIAQIKVPVQFSVAAQSDSIQDIQRLFVQFKASGQCRKWIDHLTGIKIITTNSNMESFYRVEQGKPGDAAIVPRHMLQSTSARFTLENVTDSDNNDTRFVVVAPLPQEQAMLNPAKRIRVPFYIVPDNDHPGILFEILKGFSDRRINLVSIMSRPTKQNMGTYNFFAEIDGEYNEKEIILDTLRETSRKFKLKILGIFSV